MKIAIISDDLTGASDCGGQLVRYGLDVSVVLNPSKRSELTERDAMIFNTDSRSVSEEEAYQRVRNISEWIKQQSFDVVYKKIDSTMRGNIGQEINAMYDVFQPDLVLIAPAYPTKGRKVINGVHFLHEQKLHETEVGTDPKTPVSDSHITRLIQQQANRHVEHLSHKDLHLGYEWVAKRLAAFKAESTCYVTVDSTDEADLEAFAEMVKRLGYSVIWVGSAGLMNHLPKVYGLKQKQLKLNVPKNNHPVLLVIGSVSEVGREQLKQLLLTSDAFGVEMQATRVILDDASKEVELKRLLEEVEAAFQQGKNVALFSSRTVEETQKLGKMLGLNAIQISNRISNVLGEFANHFIAHFSIRRLFLTGGDTAHQVFEQLKVNDFQLIGEVESGVPIGQLDKDGEILAVTKAGSFGTKDVMVKAILHLQGKADSEAQIQTITKIC